ncbi:GNAT family N-acetyltransferase [Glycomyces sp. NRRL B-16210]|uniref:GNAT family N-acetyltransferase n=1 Tax=Glycomyces sp. NRRL B-16210 TaxID=1463821 RepID=UPI0004BFBA8E|nr:GNAT family N-acetyltransferase [Glycomyces sp. NRRL B-16210]
MAEASTDRSRAPVVLRGLRPGDLGWIVYSQGKGYAEHYGWNGEYEALVARIVADFAAEHGAGDGPKREAGWIAEIDGRPVGSILCVSADPGNPDADTAKLRLLWVEPAGRGRGVGTMLVRRCVDFAREQGYTAMTLWTTSMLHPALRLYRAAGFTLASEEPVRLFGQDDLTAQVWELDLRTGGGPQN